MGRSKFEKRSQYKKSDAYIWYSSGSSSRRRDDGDDDRYSKLIGIEFGVGGNEYLEYSENPQLVDLVREEVGATAYSVGFTIPSPNVGVPASHGLIVLSSTPKATYWAATSPEAAILWETIPGYELSSAQGAFEIIDDDEILFGSI